MKKLFLAASALALSGCALLDPYSASRNSGIYDAESSPLAQDTFANPSLVAAITEGHKLQYAYLKAAGQHDAARAIVGALIIGGASYALLMGVSEGIGPGNAEDQIAAIAAGSAAIYGGSRWLISPRRQDAWIAGAKAVACAQERVKPFLMDPDDYKALGENLTALDTSQGEVEALIQTIKGAAGYSADTSAKNLVAYAEQAVTKANSIRTAGRALRLEVDSGAAAALQATIRKIDADVAMELRKAAPELDNILTITDGLGGIAGKISPTFTSSPKEPAQAGASEVATMMAALKQKMSAIQREGLGKVLPSFGEDVISLREHLAGMNAAANHIEGVTTATARAVSDIDESLEGVESRFAAVKLLTGCKFESIAAPPSANPAKLTFTAAKSSTQRFRMTGGEPGFTPYFSGNQPNGLQPRFDPPLSRNGVVTSTDAVEEGEFVLTIIDRNGTSTSLEIDVAKAEEGQERSEQALNNVLGGFFGIRPPGPAIVMPSNLEAAAIRDKEAIKTVQRALCLEDEDGIIGPKTIAAIRQYNLDANGRDSSRLSDEDFEYLQGEDQECRPESRSWYESRMSFEELVEILNAMQTTGVAVPPASQDMWPNYRALVARGKELFDLDDVTNYRGVMTRALCEAAMPSSDICIKKAD